MASTLEKYVANKQLIILHECGQVKILHTRIRDAKATREDFVFNADRLIRLIMEEALSRLPVTALDVVTPTGDIYHGAEPACGVVGVSIMRAGESMEMALRATCRGARIGKILIQRDESTADKAPDPRYNYAKMPADISERKVLLLDPMLATGGSAMRAVDTLINRFGCKEESIMFLNVVSCPEGIEAFLTKYPKIQIITSAVDAGLNEHRYILPGLGDFGDRYFGTN